MLEPDPTTFVHASLSHEPGSTIFGKYTVEKILGSGGMSVVYECTDRLVDRKVAVKVMLPQVMGLERSHLRFQQEAKAVARLNHPNIVKLLDFSIENGVPLIVMENVEGQSLDKILAHTGPMPMPRVLNIAKLLVEALQHAHSHNVIHRDLKPSNIILKNEEFPVLVDFGIAKVSTENLQVKATQTGEVFGSPAYMSPEQILGKSTDARCDQYSLACVIFECLTGCAPFVRDSAVNTMCGHLNEAPPSLSEASLGKKFPKWLEQLVSRLLEKDPEKRFASMAEVGAALASESVSVPERTDVSLPQASKLKKDPWPIVIGLAIIAISAIVSMAIDSPPPRPLPSPQEHQQKPMATVGQAADEAADEAVADKQVSDDINKDPFAQHYSSQNLDINDEAIKTISTLTKLQTLDLSGCTHLTGKTLSALNSTRVTKIVLAYSGITDEGVANLAMCKALEELSLEGCKNIKGATISDLAHTNLNKLRIDKTPINDSVGKSLAALRPTLQVLYIANTEVSNKIAPTLAKLRELVLLDASQTHMSGQSLSLIKDLPHLHTLLFAHLSLKGGLDYIAHSHLTELNVHKSDLTDDGLRSIARNANLLTLDISGTQISDAALKDLAPLEHLSGLNISETKISDKGMKDLARLKHLRVLGMNDTRISDLGLKELVVLQDLKTLNIADCEGVTLKAIQQLQAALPGCKIQTQATHHFDVPPGMLPKGI